MGGCSCVDRNVDQKSQGSPRTVESGWEYDENVVSVTDVLVESGCGVSQADAGSDLAETSGSTKVIAESSNIQTEAEAIDLTTITKEEEELRTEAEPEKEEEPELEDAPSACMSDVSDEEETPFKPVRTTITFNDDEPEVTRVPSNTEATKRTSDIDCPKRRVTGFDTTDGLTGEAEKEKLLKVAKIMEQDGLFVALDSTGSAIPKALKRYGLDISDNASAEEMKRKVHEMRSRIFTNPKFSGKRIIGVLLSEQTLDCEIKNMPTAEYLWEKKGIIPFLSCHIGFEKEKDGCQLMANMSKLEKMLEHCVSKNVFGAKLHSIINAPKLAGIKRVVEQQVRAAKMILAKGLMPVLEPEIDMNASNKWECEEMLLDLLTSELGKLAPNQKVMLQLALPSKRNFFLPLICHPNVLRLLALSGGYDLETSCKKLSNNTCMVACWNRAFIQGMSATQSQEELTHTIYKACKTIASAGARPDTKQLQLIMLKEKKGFFSCLDQQSPEINKQVLEAYGVNADAYQSGGDLLTKAHEFRSRIITSRAYHGGRVLAAVIPKATMDRKINGVPTSTYLWSVKHIVSFLRIGVGLEEEKNGCQMAKPIPNLDKLLSKAAENGICGVKFHSHIHDANEEGIQSIVNQQFTMARKVMGCGLVPVLEPQIDAKAKRKEMCEELLLKCIMQVMKDLSPEQRVIFSLTIPIKARLYKPLCDHPSTLRVIAIHHAAATKKISENVGLGASFGRSFLEGLKVSHTDEQFNQIVESSCDSIYKALR